MGVMRFTVHPEGLLDPDSDARRAYVSGFDGRVFPARVEPTAGQIEIRRVNSDSGKLHIAYPVEGFGRPVICTATLRESDDPYILALELARGRIVQLRNQLATWEGLGMTVPDGFREIHRESHSLFAQATAAKQDVAKASTLADQAIAKSLKAAEMLTSAYVRQRLMVRLKRSAQLPVSFGCGINCGEVIETHGEVFQEAFTSAALPIRWKEIEKQEGEYEWDLLDKLVEWGTENRLLLRGGPLLNLAPDGLPGWLQQWGHDFFNLQSFLSDFVETAINRYLGRVRIWEVSSRVNTGGAFKLNEEERLTLVARTLEVARQVDEEAQLQIRIDQPWGAYQAAGEHRLSPIQFVDALLRCGVGLSGVNLEIAAGYNDQGASPRDLLDTSRLIDQWSMLEVPLSVTLAYPSTALPDPACTSPLVVRAESCSEEEQAKWIDKMVSLLMAKQSVVGIYWSHLADKGPHGFPNAGLINSDGTTKDGIQSFLKHRSGRSLS
jgi:hypothetical protein